MKRILLAVILLGLATPCFALARYAGKKDMIREAQVIAMVNITNVQEVNTKGKRWTYQQKALATVERCLKGNAEKEIEIYGMEEFVCARCRYEKGRFILFLRSDGTLWAGSNWHLGIRPITKDRIEWFNDENCFEMKEVPLADVISEINAIVEEQKKNTPNKPDAGDGK